MAIPTQHQLAVAMGSNILGRDLRTQLQNAEADDALTTPATGAAGAKVVLAEGTDNGENTVTMAAPASLAADRTITLPDASVDLTDVNTMAGAGAQAVDAAASPTFVTPSVTDISLVADATANGTGVVLTSAQPQVRTVLLTLTSVAVVMVDNAGVVAYGGLKILDFPQGSISILGAAIDLALTLSAAGINSDWDGDVGLGTVTADNSAGPLATTEQNIVPNTATPQAVASVTTAKAKSTATELAAGVFDGTTDTGAAIDVFLNFKVDDADHDVTGTPTNIVCDGTVRITYVNLGDIA